LNGHRGSNCTSTAAGESAAAAAFSARHRDRLADEAQLVDGYRGCSEDLEALQAENRADVLQCFTPYEVAHA